MSPIYTSDDLLSKKSASALRSDIALGSETASMASAVLFGKIATIVMVGISFVLVSRLLGPSQYGIYTLATAFAGIFGSIGYFGVGTALQKFISQHKDSRKPDVVDHLVSNAIAIVLLSGIVIVAISILLSNLIAQYVFHVSGLGYIIELASAWVISLLLFGTLYDALIGLGGGKDLVVITVTEAFFQAAISILLAFLGFGASAPLYGLIFGYLVGFVVGVLFVLRHNKISLRMPSVTYLKTLLSFSAPVALSNTFGNIAGNIGLVYLGYFVLPAVIGNIGIAARVSSFAGLALDSVGLSILPAFSAAMASGKPSKEISRMYGYTIYIAMLVIAPALFYMAAFSVPFTYTFFGSSYGQASLYVSIVCIGVLISIIGTYASTLLVSAGMVKSVLMYNSVVYAALLALLFVVIPRFGGVGYALISFIAVPLLTDLVFVHGLRKMYKLDLRLGKLARLVLADLIVVSVLMIPAEYIGGIPMLLIAGIGFVLIYPLLSVLLGGANEGDLDTLKALSKNIPIVGSVLGALANYAAVAIR